MSHAPIRKRVTRPLGIGSWKSHGSFICVPWLIRIYDTTHSCVRHDAIPNGRVTLFRIDWFWDSIFRTKCEFVEDYKIPESRSYLVITEQSWYKFLFYEVFKSAIKISLSARRGAWLIHTCSMTRSSWRHDSFLCSAYGSIPNDRVPPSFLTRIFIQFRVISSWNECAARIMAHTLICRTSHGTHMNVWEWQIFCFVISGIVVMSLIRMEVMAHTWMFGNFSCRHLIRLDDSNPNGSHGTHMNMRDESWHTHECVGMPNILFRLLSNSLHDSNPNGSQGTHINVLECFLSSDLHRLDDCNPNGSHGTHMNMRDES